MNIQVNLWNTLPPEIKELVFDQIEDPKDLHLSAAVSKDFINLSAIFSKAENFYKNDFNKYKQAVQSESSSYILKMTKSKLIQKIKTASLEQKVIEKNCLPHAIGQVYSVHIDGKKAFFFSEIATEFNITLPSKIEQALFSGPYEVFLLTNDKKIYSIDSRFPKRHKEICDFHHLDGNLQLIHANGLNIMFKLRGTIISFDRQNQTFTRQVLPTMIENYFINSKSIGIEITDEKKVKLFSKNNLSPGKEISLADQEKFLTSVGQTYYTLENADTIISRNLDNSEILSRYSLGLNLTDLTPSISVKNHILFVEYLNPNTGNKNLSLFDYEKGNLIQTYEFDKKSLLKIFEDKIVCIQPQSHSHAFDYKNIYLNA